MSTKGTHTCVVADDDPAVREFITRVLSGAQFHVLAASDGREAGALIAAHQCDLLVIDLVMPGSEGIETIRALRRGYPALKILAISGVFGNDMLHAAELLGADAVMAKPFTAETLIDAVGALLERA
jgi:DNA-binding response OmpR family regulator